jgi:RimJ/RimL family protein N-acetyltransferase
MQWINGGRPTPRDVLQDHLDAYLGYYTRTPGYGFWPAVEKSSDEFIGWFHLRPNLDEGAGPDEPELGYRLRRAAWGKGYATEGSRALIRKAFTELGARRVCASTDAINIRSRRVMEKCGMVLVRTFVGPRPDDPEGERLEAVEYALERSAWEAAATT